MSSLPTRYAFEFNIGHARYTIVANRYSQAARHFRAFWVGGYVVTYKGRYSGATVKNGQCVKVTRAIEGVQA
jgi:hypothetical protein